MLVYNLFRRERALLGTLLLGRVCVGDGRPLIDQGAVLVEDGRIAFAGRAPDLEADAHEVIDYGQRTLLPGLIDAHNHICLDPGDHERQMREPLSLMSMKATQRCRVDLRSGVTTLRSVGDPGGIDVQLREEIAAGRLAGPRLLVAGAPITRTGGHAWQLGGEADGVDAVRRTVRQQVRLGVDLIKIMASGGVSTEGSDPSAAEMTAEEIATAIEEAHARGLKAAAHAHGGPGARYAVESGIDTVEHGTQIDDPDLIGLMRERGTLMVINLWNSNPKRYEDPAMKARYPKFHFEKGRALAHKAFENFPRFVAAGIPIATGTDCHHGKMWLQVESLVEGGMSVLQALQAATLMGARACGLEQETGSLEQGKLADVLVVGTDPLTDVAAALQDVVDVWQAGKRVVVDGVLVA